MTFHKVPFFEVHLGCCNSGRSIALPRQTPLGIYEHLSYQHTAEWPATFLCISCGRLFEDSEQTSVRFAQQVLPAQSLPLPDLWRIEFECDHENCGKLSTIYTSFEAGALESDVANVVSHRLPILQCSGGHDFSVNETTLRTMERSQSIPLSFKLSHYRGCGAGSVEYSN